MTKGEQLMTLPEWTNENILLFMSIVTYSCTVTTAVVMQQQHAVLSELAFKPKLSHWFPNYRFLVAHFIKYTFTFSHSLHCCRCKEPVPVSFQLFWYLSPMAANAQIHSSHKRQLSLPFLQSVLQRYEKTAFHSLRCFFWADFDQSWTGSNPPIPSAHCSPTGLKFE